jgi:hypothetical protein
VVRDELTVIVMIIMMLVCRMGFGNCHFRLRMINLLQGCLKVVFVKKHDPQVSL